MYIDNFQNNYLKLPNRMQFTLISLLSLNIFLAMNFNNSTKSKIVCFGDSITHGAKVNGRSWVYILSKEHQNFDFINEGRNGRKTSDKKELLPILKKYSDANYFLIFLGVNDLKNGNDSLVDLCVGDMKWMIEKIRQSNKKVKIVILSPSKINLKTMSLLNIEKNYNKNTEKSLIKLEIRYRALAKKDSVEFISLLNTVSPQNYVDGLHPNENGQQEIANKIWSNLDKIFNL